MKKGVYFSNTQLLMLSRNQPGRPEVVDLNAVVSGLAGKLGRMLGERITVTTRLVISFSQQN